MKQLKVLRKYLLPAALIAAGFALLSQATQLSLLGVDDGTRLRLQGVGELQPLGGIVRQQMAGESFWKDITDSRESLANGDSVFTGSDGRAIIRYSSGLKLEVRPNSVVTIRRASPTGRLLNFFGIDKGKATVKVDKGSFRVLASSDDEKLQVEAGSEVRELNAVAGSDTVVSVGEQGLDTHVVAAQTVVTTWAELSPAHDSYFYATAPNGSDFSADLKFSWKAEGIPSEAQQELVLEGSGRVADGNTSDARRLGPGKYRWRVVCFAGGSSCGASEWNEFEVALAPAPDVKGVPGGNIEAPPTGYSLAVEWNGTQESKCELALRRDGEAFLLKRSDCDEELTALLPTGTYSWQVRRVSADGAAESEWSKPGDFRITAAPTAKLAAAEEAEPEEEAKGDADAKGMAEAAASSNPTPPAPVNNEAKVALAEPSAWYHRWLAIVGLDFFTASWNAKDSTNGGEATVPATVNARLKLGVEKTIQPRLALYGEAAMSRENFQLKDNGNAISGSPVMLLDLGAGARFLTESGTVLSAGLAYAETKYLTRSTDPAYRLKIGKAGVPEVRLGISQPIVNLPDQQVNFGLAGAVGVGSGSDDSPSSLRLRAELEIKRRGADSSFSVLPYLEAQRINSTYVNSQVRSFGISVRFGFQQ